MLKRSFYIADVNTENVTFVNFTHNIPMNETSTIGGFGDATNGQGASNSTNSAIQSWGNGNISNMVNYTSKYMFMYICIFIRIKQMVMPLRNNVLFYIVYTAVQ